MAAEPLRKRFTCLEYHAMAGAGIFTEDDRVELIEGEIYQMAAIGNRHAGCVNRLNAFFTGGLGNRVIVSVQNPVQLNDFSEPEPDLAILRPRADFYSESHPAPGDILLVVEVADASLEYDRRKKIPIYARNGVAEAWLADLSQPALVVHREPSPQGYRQVQHYRPGERVAPQAFPDLLLEVSALLA